MTQVMTANFEPGEVVPDFGMLPQLSSEPHHPLFLSSQLHLELLLRLLLNESLREEEGDATVVLCRLLHRDDRSEVRNPGTRASHTPHPGERWLLLP